MAGFEAHTAGGNSYLALETQAEVPGWGRPRSQEESTMVLLNDQSVNLPPKYLFIPMGKCYSEPRSGLLLCNGLWLI